MPNTALSPDDPEMSLAKRFAVWALLGWMIAFVIITGGLYLSVRSGGWPMWIGVGAFAATFAGPYFGGAAALARHLVLVDAAERRAAIH